MKKIKKIVSMMLALVLLASACITDGFGVWAANGETDVEINKLYSGHNGNIITFELSVSDYGSATQEMNAKHTEYNYWSNIQVYTSETEYCSLGEAHTGQKYYAMWGRANQISIELKSEVYSKITKIIVPVGTVFPSKIYTNDSGSDKGGYVTTQNLVFEKPSTISESGTDWTKKVKATNIETTIEKIQIRDASGKLLLFLSQHDYSSAKSTTSIEKIDEYETLNHIIVYKSETEYQLLSELVKTGSQEKYYNIWGDTGSVAFDLPDGWDGTTVKKVVIQTGCEFPSYEYTNNQSNNKIAYVTNQETIFETTTTDINNSSWTKVEKVLPKKLDTEVTAVHVRDGKLLLFLQNHDYPDLVATADIGEKINEYNIFNYITLSTANETKTLSDVTGAEKYYNIWGEKNCIAFGLKEGWNGTTIKSITIKGDCEFPSYVYTNGTGKARDAYVTKEDKNFITNSPSDVNTDWTVDYGKEQRETSIEKIHVRDGFVLLFLSRHDYENVEATKSIGALLSEYNLISKIFVTTESETKILSEILGTEMYYNIWGEKGCVAFKMKEGYDGTTIKKVTVGSGAEIPSYEYTSGETKKLISYVTTKDVVYITNTKVEANTDWIEVSPYSTETKVTKVENSKNGHRICFTLSANDYENAEDNCIISNKHKDFNYFKNIRVYTAANEYMTLEQAYDDAEVSYYNMFTVKGTISINLQSQVDEDAQCVVIPAGTTFPSYAYTEQNQGELTGYYVAGEVIFEKQENGEWKDVSVGISNLSGDINGDRKVDVSDLVAMAKYLEKGYRYNTSSLTYDSALTDAENRSNVRKVLAGKSLHSYVKESETMTYFSSSDRELDSFLNDYYKRHIGYYDYVEGDMKVGNYTIGTLYEGIFNHHWNMEAITWLNTGNDFKVNRLEGMKKITSNILVDAYGYVWDGTDTVEDTTKSCGASDNQTHQMGWPFPNAAGEYGTTTYWDFNNKTDGWSSNCNASIANGVYTGTASGASSVTFEINGKTKLIDTAHSPYLAFDLRMGNVTGTIRDIKLYYTTSANESFSDNKMVTVSALAPVIYNYAEATQSYAHMTYLPMYTQSNWYNATEKNTYIYGIKIEIVGENLSGNFGLNYVRPYYDTRYSDNNGGYISSVREYYDVTGDLEFLQANMTNVRKAIGFYKQMYNESVGLIDLSYMQGHDGDKDTVYKGISNGYYDVLYTPKVDFSANVYFCQALKDAAYLEGVLSRKGINIDKDLATIKAPTNKTKGNGVDNVIYSDTKETLETLANSVQNKIQSYFWNDGTGRFMAGYDNNNQKVDYGYLMWNLEAVELGVATEEQATSITKWVNGERTVSGDKSTGSDIYGFGLAPRVTTGEGDSDYVKQNHIFSAYFKKAVAAGTIRVFGEKQIQYGGANMYTSYYDLMNRVRYDNADSALTRLTGIKGWYQTIKNYSLSNNVTPFNFYESYYKSTKYSTQSGAHGDGTGVIGIQGEFTESLLTLAAIPKGFFGVKYSGDTLSVNPALPSSMDHWKIENMQFHGVLYDLSIFKDAVRIDSVRGETAGLTVQITLDCPDGKEVYVNGVRKESTKASGKATVTIDFAEAVVEVK